MTKIEVISQKPSKTGFLAKIMTKFEVMLQKLQKCKKIDYMVRAGRPIS